MAEMFLNKWFIRFCRLRQIAQKDFFARYVDWVWSGIAHANITCCGIEHCDWLKPMDHRKSTPMSKKKSLEIWDFLPSLYECTLQKSNMPLKNLNWPGPDVGTISKKHRLFCSMVKLPSDKKKYWVSIPRPRHFQHSARSAVLSTAV